MQHVFALFPKLSFIWGGQFLLSNHLFGPSEPFNLGIYMALKRSSCMMWRGLTAPHITTVQNWCLRPNDHYQTSHKCLIFVDIAPQCARTKSEDLAWVSQNKWEKECCCPAWGDGQGWRLNLQQKAKVHSPAQLSLKQREIPLNTHTTSHELKTHWM